ncbi:hypothetical protein PR202_gb02565 [Eleusine coracana subsp. coracana]|uniref:NTF2-related export protein n=1 Tax=Eleusine coracana subsp. coracana TaxID=191504 RepID=A0AAV5DYW2_ELECO|nr:hypothetical protein PR202_gb02565 [Eleusine coracana subsp. coracana]
MAMDPDAVARAFVEHYYATFDTNRAALATLYQDGSMLTFEGDKILGTTHITNKLTSLPFQQCQHTIATVDCQPSGPQGGMLVFVSGSIRTSPNPEESTPSGSLSLHDAAAAELQLPAYTMHAWIVLGGISSILLS